MPDIVVDVDIFSMQPPIEVEIAEQGQPGPPGPPGTPETESDYVLLFENAIA